jgi:RecA-family ATPase
MRQTCLFTGEGAAGKSLTQLYLCAAHVLAADWLGQMPKPGPAFFIDAEDEEGELHRRLATILRHFGASFQEAIDGGLYLKSLAGEDAVFATSTKGGIVQPTPLYKSLLERAGDLKPKMIGIASSANIFAGNEIVRPEVQQFVGLLTKMAIAANGAVNLIAHPSLTGINTDTGLSGSTQWHNAVRSRMWLRSPKPEPGEQPDNDLREIVFKKNNYGPVSESIVLRWKDGLFLPVPGMASLDRAAQEMKADEVFLSLLRRFTRENRSVSDRKGTNYAPSVFAKEDEVKKAGLKSTALADAMRRLFKAEKIWNEPYKRDSKNSFRLAVK